MQDEFVNDFNMAYIQASDLYGVEMNPDEFENIALIAWNRIGNKQYRLYRMIAEPEKDSTCGEFTVDLPCNVDVIEAVTACLEDVDYTSNTHNDYYRKQSIEQDIESSKFHTNKFYPHGKYVKYNRVQNTLYLDEPFGKIMILYKGVIVDDEGLPYLTNKEVDAIAAFCAYTQDFKISRMIRDKDSLQMSQMMKQEWLRLCTSARVPEFVNQNQMDEILNVAASWDRKRFGKSFKPIR